MLKFGSSKFEKNRKIETIKKLFGSGYTFKRLEEENLFDSESLFVYLTANSDKFNNLCFTRRKRYDKSKSKTIKRFI